MVQSNVITDIESKTKATRNLDLKNLIFLAMYMMFAYMLRDNVNGLLYVPYMIFSFACGLFLMMPSSFNKKRNHLYSIVILIKNDAATYRPYFPQQESGDEFV